jgi:hypothetical protein
MGSRGENIGRRLTGGVSPNDTTQRTREWLQGGAAPFLQRAVVVEVFYDPTSLTQEELERLQDTVANPELVEGMPVNSILARMVTNSQDLGTPSLFIFFPLFSSHFQLPAKAGEQVVVLFEDYSRMGGTVGYWLTRPMAVRQVEDVNYTHADRVYDPYNHPMAIPRGMVSSLTASAPTFPNGAGTPESFSLQPSGSGNPYDAIVNTSKAMKQFTFEPVPRFRKRPGDLLLQGSNNSMVLLGSDRTGPSTKVSGSQGKDIVELAGVVDIVTGFGSVRKFPTDHRSDPNQYSPTAPRVIENVRGKKEVYKTPYKSQKVDNPKEGDPDFLRDLSRLYLAMKTKGDLNFGIQFGGNSGILPNSQNYFGTAVADLPSQNQDGQPFAVLKSEQVRLIAKGKDADNGPSESGEIRLIKEGTVDDKDLSVFVMSKDGRVLMMGKDVQIQTHQDGKVLLKCKTAEASDADPIVLYSKFKECVEDIYSKLNELRNETANQLANVANTGLSVVNAAGPFSPIPGLIGAKASLLAARGSLQALNLDFRPKIAPCRSKWVFVNKENQS